MRIQIQAHCIRVRYRSCHDVISFQCELLHVMPSEHTHNIATVILEWQALFNRDEKSRQVRRALVSSEHKECRESEKQYLMFARLQWVIITDEEEAHGGHQELKQLHQGGVTPIWPHLHPSPRVNNADCDVAYLTYMTGLRPCAVALLVR